MAPDEGALISSSRGYYQRIAPILCGVLCETLRRLLSSVLCGILRRLLSSVLCGIQCGILRCILCGSLCGILHGNLIRLFGFLWCHAFSESSEPGSKGIVRCL